MHLVVNHSENFVDPGTGTHTNAIEGRCSHVKASLPLRHRSPKHLLGQLARYMLMKKLAKEADPFAAFIRLCAILYHDPSMFFFRLTLCLFIMFCFLNKFSGKHICHFYIARSTDMNDVGVVTVDEEAVDVDGGAG